MSWAKKISPRKPQEWFSRLRTGGSTLPNGFLMEDGSNLNIKVGHIGLSKAVGGGSLFRR
jgi:hypothetical protein